ncbi:apolipoprotein B receptor [Dasypus novemcinctus]|uniref:apolipoprotein B receptor n=1 Tax=Dasypus novemcinctus TaxID=9361 RepID=UPI00265DEA5E|nr:apolipoprotein B receptor [Dasypus novemcinctus]
MDFLRLHLPGLHQALRGALDSFSTFVAYLLGDEVPTAAGREAQAAKELGEVTTGRPGRAVEEEAQEALEGLRGWESKGDRELSGPGEARRRQEGDSAAEQTWDWKEGSSQGSQADRQDPGAWEAAKTTACQEPSAPVEARRRSEVGSGADGDESSQTPERQEPNEQEVNTGETLRTWKLEEEEEKEEEEVRVKEPRAAGGVESEWTWHGEPEGKAGAGWQKAAGDGRETEQVVKEAVAEETPEPGARGPGREEEMVVVVSGDQSIAAQGTQGPGAESEVWATSGWEEADLPGVRETEPGVVSGERPPEGTESIWTLDEVSKEDWKELVDEKREAEERLFLKHSQALGSEGGEEVAEDQLAGSAAAGGRESEEEVGAGFQDQAAWDGTEAEEKQDSEIRADEASLEEVVQAEEAKEEKGNRWTAEAEVPQHKEAKAPEGEADLEAIPEARPEKALAGERCQEEVQTGWEALSVGWGGLEHEVTEGQAPELMEGAQTPAKTPEEGQGAEEELWAFPGLSKEEAEESAETYPRDMGSVRPDFSEAEASGNRERGDMEKGDTQEERPDAEEGEGEVTGNQALEAEVRGGQVSGIPEVPEAGEQWKRAKDARCGSEEGEALGAEAGAGQALQESEKEERESKDGEGEMVVLCGADRPSWRGWSLEEEALSLRDREDTQIRSPSAAEIVEDKDVGEARAEDGEAWDAGLRRGWDLEGTQEAGGGAELAGAQPEEAAGGQSRGRQEFGLDCSAEGEATGLGRQAEAFQVREGEQEGDQAGAGEPAAAAGSCGMGHFPSGFQGVREPEGFTGEQVLEETEAGGWQEMKQGEDSEGQPGDHPSKGEERRFFDMEDVEEPGSQKPVAKEVDPEGLEDIEGPKEQSTDWDPPEAEPRPHWEAEAAEATGSATREARGSWSEATLPGSLLDVSVPRSRVLLSRSSSQRRSRPSFRRAPTCEQQQEPPSPPPEEEPPSPPPEEQLSAPEQSPLQPEEPPEPSPPRPEGTPVPARRRPLGYGFGLAHSGMMQELQARLGQPKPQ